MSRLSKFKMALTESLASQCYFICWLMVAIRVVLLTPLWIDAHPLTIRWYIHFSHIWVGVLLGLSLSDFVYDNRFFKAAVFITVVEIVAAILQVAIYGSLIH